MKPSAICGILSVILGIIVVVIIVKTHCNLDPKENLLLFRTRDGTIQLFTNSTKEIKPVAQNAVHGITSFVPYRNGTIFYGIPKPRTPILSSSMEHKNLYQHTEKITKTAMAVDHETGKIYVVDKLAGKVFVIDINNGQYAVILSGLKEPRDLALDLEYGYIFILFSSSIIRANLNGLKKKTIIQHPNIDSFTLDHIFKILYYSDKQKVGSYQYKDDFDMIPLEISNATSLSFGNKHLFYVKSTDKSSNKTLMACYLNKWECKNTCCRVDKLYADPKLEEVKFYDDEPRKIQNFCAKDNGGCEQMCLSHSSQCACTEGWVLVDATRCFPEDKLFINMDETGIKQYDVRFGNLSRSLINSSDGITSFDLDGSHIFYTTTDQEIKSSDNKYKVLEIDKNWSGTGLAVDKTTNKLYMVDEIRGEIKVADIKRDYVQILMSGLHRPRNVVLDSESGLMFVQQHSSILQANMDGTNVKEKFRDPGVSAIAIDRRNKKLYYAVSEVILCLDYRENKSHLTTKLDNGRIISLAIVSGDLFAIVEKDFVIRSLQRCKLPYGTKNCNFVSVYQNNSMTDIRSTLVSANELETPCDNNNGGCEHLCLLTNNVKRYNCACSTGWILNPDKKSCKSNSAMEDNEIEH